MKKSYCLGCSILAAATIAIFIFIAPILFSPCHELQFANMKSAGVEEYKLWFPEWMPASAVNIQAAAHLDNWQIIMKYRLDTKDLNDLTSGSRQASRDIIVPHPCGLKWWDRRAIHHNIKSGDFIAYEGPDRNQDATWYFTHDGTEVYMWRIPYNNLMPY